MPCGRVEGSKEGCISGRRLRFGCLKKSSGNLPAAGDLRFESPAECICQLGCDAWGVHAQVWPKRAVAQIEGELPRDEVGGHTSGAQMCYQRESADIVCSDFKSRTLFLPD